eukprot:3273754-Ditylum_brightwellii.AAC.1
MVVPQSNNLLNGEVAFGPQDDGAPPDTTRYQELDDPSKSSKKIIHTIQGKVIKKDSSPVKCFIYSGNHFQD